MLLRVRRICRRVTYAREQKPQCDVYAIGPDAVNLGSVALHSVPRLLNTRPWVHLPTWLYIPGGGRKPVPSQSAVPETLL